MKEWKSRLGIDPPPQFFAEVLAYLDRAFPGATLTREEAGKLRPFLIQQWRFGQNAPKAAAATCSCDGQRITPSPASQIELPRRSALAPRGADRSAIFGVEDLRERAPLARLRVKAEIANRQREHFEAQHRARSGTAGSKGNVAAAKRVESELARWSAESQRLNDQVAKLVASEPWARRAGASEQRVARNYSPETPAAEEAKPRKRRSRRVSKSDATIPREARPLVLTGVILPKDGSVGWTFKGSPDARLLYRRKDGQQMTAEDAQRLAAAQSPGLLKEFETRIFGSQSEAEAAAAEVAQPITQIFIPKEVASALEAKVAAPVTAPKSRRGRKPKTECEDCAGEAKGAQAEQMSLDELVREFAESAAKDEEASG